MEIANGTISTTTKVWNILAAAYKGNLEKVKEMAAECPDLVYAQYNYTPPVHFAVREGHTDLVKYLLEKGAHDPAYRTYPFLDSLQNVAEDRVYDEIKLLLEDYCSRPSLQKYSGDNGRIHFPGTNIQLEFQKAVDEGDLIRTEQILKEHPEFAKDETCFWGEGILTFAAKTNNRLMTDLLMSYGAKVPDILKWAPEYYFEHNEGAVYMMEKGMNPNTMSWHHVTVLHDMARKGDIQKAEILIRFGADTDVLDEEYQSTPLAMAARWGQTEMVDYLIKTGAGVNKSGASWSAPLKWAVKYKHSEAEKLLLKAGAK